MITDQDLKETILSSIDKHRSACFDFEARLKYFEQLNNPFQQIIAYRQSIEDMLLPTTSFAESQLLDILKIPISYFHRCPLDLKVANFDYWVSQFQNQRVLIRQFGNEIRAIVSTRFNTKYDDYLIFPKILDELESLEENILIKNFVQQQDVSMLEILFKDSKITYENYDYIAGIRFVNSEIGKSALWIRPIIDRQWKNTSVSNHTTLFSDSSLEGTTSIRHIGHFANYEKIYKTGLQQAKKTAEVGIYQLLKASKEIITNLIESIKEFGKQSDNFTKNILNILEEEYEDILEATRLEIAVSMLKAIAKLPLFQMIQTELEVGRYLNLFEDTDSKYEEISQDLLKIQNSSVINWDLE